jgi:hypothetical protein
MHMSPKVKREKVISATLQILLVVTVLLVIFITWHKFYYTKNFIFSLEAPCDIKSQSCFLRSCMNEGDYCPPNEFQAYRVFHIKAADFETCADDTCLQECLEGTIECGEVYCVEDEITSCSGEV